MSLSKGYPYSFTEKLKYYSGKFFCYGAVIVGADLYSKFLWKQPSLTNTNIKEKNSDELYELVSISKNKMVWHFKSMLIDVCIFIPTSVLVYRLKPFTMTSKQMYATIGTAGALCLNSVYGILTHSYNYIRISHQLNRMKYGIIESIVEEQLIKEKCQWNMFEKGDGHNKTFIVHNEYYKNLIFFFEQQEIAQQSKEFLMKLPATQVDLMNENAATIRFLQRKLLTSF